MFKAVIVDNNITRANLTARAIRRLNFGAHVHFALSAVQSVFYLGGLRAEKKKYPDLIILCEPLPDTSGLDALKALKESTVNEHVSIVVVSDPPHPEDRLTYYKQGAAAFIPRPQDPDEYTLLLQDTVSFVAMIMGLIPKQSKFFPVERHPTPTIGEVLQIHL